MASEATHSMDFAYDFYVDFTHKSGIIYREMTVTLLLAGITILIVVVVFYLTLKNMLLQKKSR
jgi:hypothetical protein